MRIEAMHIDGFGLYRDRRLDGFQPGINVIFGGNEAGKTTLLELVRRILFGFPDGRSRDNRYQIYPDAPLGGSLFCRLQSGESITVRRFSGPRGGELTVETPSGVFTGANALDGLLRLSPEFFRNVYAFSLDEMQSFDSLDSDEIRGRIYGAGLGLGTVSTAAVKRHFGEAAGNFFRERGSSQLLPTFCRELDELRRQQREARQELPRYEQLAGELAALERDNDAAAAALERNRAGLRELELRRSLYHDWIDAGALRQRLEVLPAAAPGEEALLRLDQYRKEETQSREALESAVAELCGMEDRLAALTVDRVLLDQVGAVAALQRQVSLYDRAGEELTELGRQREELERRIERQLAELGGIFDRDRVTSFLPDRFQTERAAGLRDRMHRTEDEVRRSEERQRGEAETRQRLAQEHSAAQASRIGVLAALLLLAVGIGAGAVAVKFSLIGGLAVGVIGVLAALLLRHRLKPETAAASSAWSGEAELERAREQLAAVGAEWSALLEELHWPSGVGVEGFTDLATRLERLAEAVESVGSLEHKRGDLSSRRAVVEVEYRRFAPFLGGADAMPSLSGGVEFLQRQVRQEQEKQIRREQLSVALAAAGQKLDALRRRHEEAAREPEQLLASWSVADGEALRRLAGQGAERRRLERELDELYRQMRKASGAVGDFDALLAELAAVDPVALEAASVELRQRLEQDERDLRQRRERVGELREQMKNLASSRTLQTLRQREEDVIGRLRAGARSWAVNVAAQRIFEAALAEYELERQPEVLRQAGAVLARITGGRYTGIFRPLDGEDLLVRAADGRTLTPGVLSRGTREELYLAMRLGLIAEYELSRTEPLPLIMDDVLVNFDDARRRAAIAALTEFAAGRQMLVLTCHRRTADDYLAAGAHAFELNSASVD